MSMRNALHRPILGTPTNENCDSKLVSPNGNTGTWIALSYCWEGNSEFALNDKTVSGLRERIPVNQYQPILRDAVLTTRYLGIQYIWIDALCIKQDSPELGRRCKRFTAVLSSLLSRQIRLQPTVGFSRNEDLRAKAPC